MKTGGEEQQRSEESAWRIVRIDALDVNDTWHRLTPNALTDTYSGVLNQDLNFRYAESVFLQLQG